MTAKRVTIGAKPTLVHRETENAEVENLSGDAGQSAASSIEQWLKQGDNGASGDASTEIAGDAPPAVSEQVEIRPAQPAAPATTPSSMPEPAVTPADETLATKPRAPSGGALPPWAGIAGGAVTGAAVAAAIAWLLPQFSTRPDPRVTPLVERVAANEVVLRQFGERIGKVDNEVAQTLDDQTATAERVTEQAGQITALNEAVVAASKRTDPLLDISSPLFAVALGQLRTTFYSGRPFEAELVNVYSIAGNSDPFATYLTELLGPARTGVPNAAELYRVFPSYVAAAGLRIGDPAGYQYGLSLVNRYVGIATETYTSEMANLAVTRASAALAGGDVAGAMAALRELDPQSSETMTLWLDAARDNLRAEAAITDMTRIVVERLRDRAKDIPAAAADEAQPEVPATLPPAETPAIADPATPAAEPKATEP